MAEKQFIIVAGAGTNHFFENGELVTFVCNSDGMGVYTNGKKQQYLDASEIMPVNVTKAKPVKKQAKKSVAVKAAKLYAVRDTKDGLFIDVFATRQEARALKAAEGGLKSGIEIIQYTPAAKIR